MEEVNAAPERSPPLLTDCYTAKRRYPIKRSRLSWGLFFFEQKNKTALLAEFGNTPTMIVAGLYFWICIDERRPQYYYIICIHTGHNTYMLPYIPHLSFLPFLLSPWPFRKMLDQKPLVFDISSHFLSNLSVYSTFPAVVGLAVRSAWEGVLLESSSPWCPHSPLPLTQNYGFTSHIREARCVGRWGYICMYVRMYVCITYVSWRNDARYVCRYVSTQVGRYVGR